MSSEENKSNPTEENTPPSSDQENVMVSKTEGNVSEETEVGFKKPKTPAEIEKEQEQQLKYRFPNLKPNAGGSALLQKRLSKPKYFDSGDYAMAKAKKQPLPQGQPKVPFTGPVPPTGEQHPTPETVLSRKTSLVQNKLLTRLS